jgi:hypothetical protein
MDHLEFHSSGGVEGSLIEVDADGPALRGHDPAGTPDQHNSWLPPWLTSTCAQAQMHSARRSIPRMALVSVGNCFHETSYVK